MRFEALLEKNLLPDFMIRWGARIITRARCKEITVRDVEKHRKEFLSYVAELKNKTGLDKEVVEYIMQFEEAHGLLQRMELPVSHVLYGMESQGAKVDMQRLTAMRDTFAADARQAEIVFSIVGFPAARNSSTSAARFCKAGLSGSMVSANLTFACVYS